MTKSSTRRSHADDDEQVSAEDILEDLRAVVRDAEELLRATGGEMGDRVDEVRERIGEKLESARERLHDIGGDKGEKVRAAARTTENYIKENPWTALLIAVGVGFLLGGAGRRR
jgi:ElaB/YqjD/DUF883 family membrane-anchored ribosome-binding protein